MEHRETWLVLDHRHHIHEEDTSIISVGVRQGYA